MKTEDKYICGKCYIDKYFSYKQKTIYPTSALCDFCKKEQAYNYIQVEIDTAITPCCNKEMKLKLSPDYCSSGVWCFHCGCMLSNVAGIPDPLMELCDIWNGLWEAQIDKRGYNRDEYFGKVFISIGKYLSELINQYCYCEMNINEETIIKDVINERKLHDDWLEYIKFKKENKND